MKGIEVHPLFAVPLLEFKIGQVNREILEYLKTLSYNPPLEVKHSDVHSSTNDNLIFHPLFFEIKSKIYEVLNFFIYKVLNISSDIKFKISDSWIVITPPGSQGVLHIHSFSFLSGVVYLDCDSENSISFINPLVGKPLSSNTVTIDFKYNKNSLPEDFNIFNSKKSMLRAVTGGGFIFHSNIPHQISTNTTNKNRISLAFNVMPTGNISFGVTQKLRYNEVVETI